MKNILFIVFVMLGQFETAQAQMISQQVKSVPVGYLHQKNEVSKRPFAFKATKLIDSSYLADHIKTSFKYYMSIDLKTPPSCESAQSYSYVLSQTIRGLYQDCRDYAKSCAQNNPTTSNALMLMQGARCQFLDYQFKDADELYQSAIKNSTSTHQVVMILEHAIASLSGVYAQNVESIIAQNSNWTADQKLLAKALVEKIVQGRSKTAPDEIVYKFIDDLIAASSDYTRSFLIIQKIDMLRDDFEYIKSHELLSQEAINFTNPLDWSVSGFRLLYSLSDGVNFKEAKNFYLAVNPFLHSRSIELPTEQNVHNYTEIYNSECSATMSQGQDLVQFKELIAKWKTGQLTTQELINEIQSQSEDFRNKSDVRSALGSLFSIIGDSLTARTHYWKAHELCAFNNRSHWGLKLLERKTRYASYPEFSKNEDFVDQTVLGLNVPKEISQFILNYDSFPLNSQKRIVYGARIWLPYMNDMRLNNTFAVIKIPFEKLSDVNGFIHLRDKRIGPPDLPNYFYDNRLWDDVRGVGGLNVAADHDEVYNAVHGDYNLLGHEMAHQFHDFLGKKYPDLSMCITKLYEAAQKRNLFADAYAKSNVQEYFAQGVTYYLIPNHFPPRYGLNQSWAENNDQELHQFIKSIDEAKGNYSLITCPVH